MELRARHQSVRRLVLLSVALVATAFPEAAHGQDPAAGQAGKQTQIGQQKMTAYAQAYVQIGAARNEIQAQFAEGGNKTPEAQAQLRENLRQRVSQILQEHSMTREEYQRITLIVSTDQAQRDAFNQVVARLNGGGGGTEGI